MSKGWLALLMMGCSLDLGDVADKVDEELGDDDDDDDRGGGDGPRQEGDDDDDKPPAGDDDDDDDDDAPARDCELGVEAYCVCIADSYGYECHADDREYLVGLCEGGEDQGLFECLAEFVDTSGYINCYDAFSVCYY
jgi:hypothetical protein